MPRIFYSILLFFLHIVSWAGVRIEVTEVPPLLLNNKPIYLASSLNNWNPGDPNYALKLQDNGHYIIELASTPDTFEYKFTQGSWNTVEGHADGLPLSNRIYDSTKDSTHVVTSIRGWESKRAFTFIVRELPENSPHDMSLFVSGNFNDWNPADPHAQLFKSVDGTWRATIYTELEKVEYKFTRGNWQSVEGKESGKARPNRVVLQAHDGKEQIVDIRIAGWEDMMGIFHVFSLYDLLLLFASFQGVLLLIAIPSIQNYNKYANRWLLLTIFISSVAIFLRLLGGFGAITLSFMKVILFPDFIIFLYAPVFYIYLNKLLFKAAFQIDRKVIYSFIPFIIQVIVYLPLFFLDNRSLQLELMNLNWKIQLLFVLTGLLGLVWNAYYWFKCRNTIRFYSQEYERNFSDEHNLHYLHVVLIIQAICLGVWLLTYAIIGFGKITDADVGTVVEQSVDLTWLFFSSIIYFVGYFAIHQQEIFNVSTSKTSSFQAIPSTYKDSITADDTPQEAIEIEVKELESSVMEGLEELKHTIDTYMRKERPYTNPKLSLQELAGKTKMQPHLLSRVINEGYQKNFFDFINSYRVEEFKTRVDNPKYRHYTLLALAFDVGFNSKTAFNRSFKKITGVTPSEYYQGITKDNP